MWQKEPDINCEFCQGTGKYPAPNGADDFDMEQCTCTFDDSEQEMAEDLREDVNSGERNLI